MKNTDEGYSEAAKVFGKLAAGLPRMKPEVDVVRTRGASGLPERGTTRAFSGIEGFDPAHYVRKAFDRCRPYCLPTDTAGLVWAAADEAMGHTLESLLSIPDSIVSTTKPGSERIAFYMDFLMKKGPATTADREEWKRADNAISAMPFPTVDDAPFPVVLYLYGAGLDFENDVTERMSPAVWLDFDDADTEDLVDHSVGLCGILVDYEQGMAWDLYRFQLKGDEGMSYKFQSVFTRLPKNIDVAPGNPRESWQDAMLRLGPWTVRILTDLTRAFRTRVQATPSLSVQRDFKKAGIKRMPPPLYRLNVSAEAVVQRSRARNVEAQQARAQLQWAHDVRAHDRLLTLRGQLPLDEAMETKLLARGYAIFRTAAAFTPSMRQALFARDIPGVRPGEWLACRVVRVRSFTRGPVDKAHVPAMRVIKSPGLSGKQA